MKSYYQVLSTVVSWSFPCKNIWKVKALSRMVFFVWTAALGKILILDNLRMRNVIVVDWCCMCNKNGESIDHLLYFEVATELWYQ